MGNSKSAAWVKIVLGLTSGRHQCPIGQGSDAADECVDRPELGDADDEPKLHDAC